MKKILLLLFLLWVFPVFVIAGTQNNHTLTWVNPADTSISAVFSAPRCIDSLGQKALNVKVYSHPSGVRNSDANVTAIVNEPGDTNNITFANQNDGNYNFTYTFDTNGTYKFQIHASDTNINDTYDMNEYVYAVDFNIVISFLNNNASYDAGNTVTIRNNVTNSDGNAFVDLNGTVDVFKPDSGTLYSDQNMTDLGTGEYTFSFAAPSTSGTYSATSTFECNSNNDSNSLGRFSVNSTGSGGGGDSGGGSGGSGGSGGGSGGSGGSGGGGGTGSEGLKAATRNFEFDKLEVGFPASATLLMSHGIPLATSFLVQLQVVRGNQVVAYSEENVLFLAPGKTTRIDFPEFWIPDAAGTYIVTITLASLDKRVVYDIQTKRFDIVGDLRYDLEIICDQIVARSGRPFNFAIKAMNFGDYYEDVDLSWWVQNSTGEKFGFSSSPYAVLPNGNFDKNASVFIPESLPFGTYTARARLIFKDVEKESFCTFSLTSPQTYYIEIITQLDKELQEYEVLAGQNIGIGQQGNFLSERMEFLREKIELMRNHASNFDFEGLDQEIVEANTEMSRVRSLVEITQNQSALNLSNVVNILWGAVGVILLIFIGQSILPRLKGGKKSGKASHEHFVEKLLGLSD